MRSILFIALFFLIIFTTDLYAFRGIRFLLSTEAIPLGGISFGYWSITVLLFAALAGALILMRGSRDPSMFFPASLLMGLFLMIYVPKIVFNAGQLLSDVASLVLHLTGHAGGKVRSVILWTGTVPSLFLFLAFGLGMIRGRTNLKTFRLQLFFRELPAGFSGIRIVQLSDIHLAGFYRKKNYIRKVIERVNALEPDLVLFTGDMVHNFSEELDPFIPVLNRLKASLGKYAILGNHDYGHYFRWDSPGAESENLERVKEKIREAGFDLLLNESRTLEQRGDKVDLIGVENWGTPPFPQKGDLARALKGTPPGRFRILMSHDPSHWNLQVRGREEIPLTLAGHTHGMQFGFELGRFRWSPSRWKYKQWAGLYKENGQYLYVNRGLGYTGFPGRVGIRPEITFLTLRRTGDP